VCKGELHLLLCKFQGFFLSPNLQCRSGGDNPKSNCDISGDSFNDLAIKTVAPNPSPVATLSPKNFLNCLNLATCFSENRPIFARFWSPVVAFWRFFAPKKSLAATAAATPYCGLWSRVFNLIFFKSNFKILKF